MHPLENFFDQIYVINLDRRPDRWTQIQSRLKRIGLEDFKRIEAVDGSKPPYYQSWQGLTRLWKGRHKLYTPQAYGYLLSMYRIFKDAVDHKYDSILILDDDVLFRSDWSVSHYQKLVEKVFRKNGKFYILDIVIKIIRGVCEIRTRTGLIWSPLVNFYTYLDTDRLMAPFLMDITRVSLKRC